MKKLTCGIASIILLFNLLLASDLNLGIIDCSLDINSLLYNNDTFRLVRGNNQSTLSSEQIKQGIITLFGEILSEKGPRAVAALQYGVTPGNPFLKMQITGLLHEQGICANPKANISIYDGTIEMREILAKLFINEGDAVVYDQNVFTEDDMELFPLLYGAQLETSDFQTLDSLRKILNEGRVKIVYISADTSVKINRKIKTQLLNLSNEFDFLIVEDATGESWSNKEDSLTAQDPYGRVIYLANLSYKLGEGLKLGFAVASEEIMGKMRIAKEARTLHPNALSQIIISEFPGLLPKYAYLKVKIKRSTFPIEDLLSWRGKLLIPSIIRRLLEVIQDPEIISFAGGVPDPNLFPYDKIGEIIKNLTDEKWAQALNAAPILGYVKLRNALVTWLGRKGISNITEDNVLVTEGSQQGLDLIGRYVGKDGVIITGERTYLGAITAFKPYGCEIMHSDLYSQDNLSILEGKIRKILDEGRKEVIYSVPTFDNPGGDIIELEQRERLINLCKKLGIRIIEDDPYGELRYKGEEIPTMKALDKDGNTVIYLTSNSKVCSPGVRIGYVVASEDIIQDFADSKEITSGPTNSLSQIIVAKFIETGAIDNYIQDVLRPEYGKRYKAMLVALNKYMPKELLETGQIELKETGGGMFIGVTLPESINTTDLLDEILKEGILVDFDGKLEKIYVAFVPGSPFTTIEGGLSNFMRLCFVTSGVQTIDKGIHALSIAISRKLGLLPEFDPEPALEP